MLLLPLPVSIGKKEEEKKNVFEPFYPILLVACREHAMDLVKVYVLRIIIIIIIHFVRCGVHSIYIIHTQTHTYTGT